jgi:uncharacterized DUF497 family protein
MEFEWDENKRAANLAKHGLDLIRGTVLFDGRPRYTYSSPHFGEQRFVTVTLLGDEFVALVDRARRGHSSGFSAEGQKWQKKSVSCGIRLRRWPR